MQLLHDWGELMWFSESATLRGVVVLSPQWLTHMFATIVAPVAALQPDDDDKSPASSTTEDGSDTDNVGMAAVAGGNLASVGLLQSPGIIDRMSLPGLWHEYDPSHYSYFEKLLESFELWIPIENGERFIVPVLLPRREPDTDCGLDWELVRYGRCFWCPFPLHGLFERCVVQLLRLFSPVKYWRNEVLLAGPRSLRILAVLAPCPMPNHPHGERLSFFFAADQTEGAASLSEMRSAVSATTFVVHNYLMDWYNVSLREQVVASAACPKCCSATGPGGTFVLEDLIRDQTDKHCEMCGTKHELSTLLVELTDARVHATAE